MEAPVLNQLAQMPGITLYGYVWKDKPENARAFLERGGQSLQPHRRGHRWRGWA